MRRVTACGSCCGSAVVRTERRACAGQASVEFVIVASVLVVALAIPVDGRSAASWLIDALEGAARGFAVWLAVV